MSSERNENRILDGREGSLLTKNRQEGILKWRGKLQWEGDLEVSREGRFLDWGSEPKEAAAHEVDAPETLPVR